VKTGKKGAVERVPNLRTILLALVALALAGCAAGPSGPAAAVMPPARILLEPSDRAYASALESLTPAEQKTLKKGLGFTVDTLLSSPIPVQTMTWSRKRADSPAYVNISDFVRFLDLQPALAGGTRINLATARVLAGLTYDQATFDPVFRLEVEVEPATGNVMTATAIGAGPACARPADEFPLSSPKLTESEQVAFLKAFLRTLLKINDQLQQAG
jgi:hypothetical protein